MKYVGKLVLFLALTLVINNCQDTPTKRSENDVMSKVMAQNFDYTYEVVVPDLDIPWGFVFLPDGSLLITEKSGSIIHFKDGTKNSIDGAPQVKVQGQGGLMDIELHPQYPENKWVYLTYASSDGEGSGANTALARGKFDGQRLTEVQQLYKATPNSRRGQHFGSRIEFDNQGYLYFSVGDRGNRDVNPQNIRRDGGKVYRLNDDGSIPLDNPFIRERAAKPAVFTYGHRNIQGMAIHPETGAIWTHEHGPRGGDEINIIEAGNNYGWPLASFGINYSGTKFTDNTTLPGMVDPLHHWTPSIAPSGMTFVTSDTYPELNGHLLVGSLKYRYVNVCYLNGDTVESEERILEGIGRVRSMRQGPDNYIYIGVENVGIIKLIPKK